MAVANSNKKQSRPDGSPLPLHASPAEVEEEKDAYAEEFRWLRWWERIRERLGRRSHGGERLEGARTNRGRSPRCAHA